MSKQTHFRDDLRQKLLRLVDPEQRRLFQEKHPFLDARHETLTSLRLDYPPEPLVYPPFLSEFTSTELDALDTFLRRIQIVDDANEDEIVVLARNLLKVIAPDTSA
jgi:hypothetical protein